MLLFEGQTFLYFVCVCTRDYAGLFGCAYRCPGLDLLFLSAPTCWPSPEASTLSWLLGSPSFSWLGFTLGNVVGMYLAQNYEMPNLAKKLEEIKKDLEAKKKPPSSWCLPGTAIWTHQFHPGGPVSFTATSKAVFLFGLRPCALLRLQHGPEVELAFRFQHLPVPVSSVHLLLRPKPGTMVLG